MKYRKAVLCEKCGAEYRTKAHEGTGTPNRCKECTSSMLRIHPNPEESSVFRFPDQYLPVEE